MREKKKKSITGCEIKTNLIHMIQMQNNLNLRSYLTIAIKQIKSNKHVFAIFFPPGSGCKSEGQIGLMVCRRA